MTAKSDFQLAGRVTSAHPQQRRQSGHGRTSHSCQSTKSLRDSPGELAGRHRRRSEAAGPSSQSRTGCRACAISIGSSCCNRDESARTGRRKCWCGARASIATWCGERWPGWRNRLPKWASYPAGRGIGFPCGLPFRHLLRHPGHGRTSLHPAYRSSVGWCR